MRELHLISDRMDAARLAPPFRNFSQMCAEQIRCQLRHETSCRRWMVPLPLLLLLLLFSGVHLGVALGVDPTVSWTEHTLDECHDEYTLAIGNAISNFTLSYELCELAANETKIDLEIDEQLERAQIELGANTACGNLQLCDEHVDHLDYFACVSDTGKQNLLLMEEIQNNATAAHTKLRQDYSEVEQILALCTLEAQVNYMNSMREAQGELQQCRDELKKQPN